jgi:haloalkane dehalogenase
MNVRDNETRLIDPVDRLPRKRVPVLDSEMSYVDVGRGDPVVFLHGNPTSSYLWRNVIPYVSSSRRCLAPDLIGMGQSGRPKSHGYRFGDHARYLDAWFDAVGLNQKLTLVGHDWGGALAFSYAHRHPNSVAAIAYMETFVQPRLWDDLRPASQEFFRRLRSPEAGEHLIFDENAFVEIALPGSIIRELTEREMAAYRGPFQQRDARLPTLAWAREQPINGSPEEVVDIVARYGQWLQRSDLPKLFINAEPGSLIGDRARSFCRTWPNQREVTVKGIHFIQEDSPHEIGAALREFLVNAADGISQHNRD